MNKTINSIQETQAYVHTHGMPFKGKILMVASSPTVYDAIFLVGGQGPMYTFRGNHDLGNLFAHFYESGKPSAAVCHSTTLLLDAKKSDGERIAAFFFLYYPRWSFNH